MVNEKEMPSQKYDWLPDLWERIGTQTHEIVREKFPGIFRANFGMLPLRIAVTKLSRRAWCKLGHASRNSLSIV
ncbi:hypothetical protein IFT84_00220 [Rhizobium sp. CFBP 8762]|nr:hypothetical protein [Rhizobium sp. CFBP 8762]